MTDMIVLFNWLVILWNSFWRGSLVLGYSGHTVSQTDGSRRNAQGYHCAIFGWSWRPYEWTLQIRTAIKRLPCRNIPANALYESTKGNVAESKLSLASEKCKRQLIKTSYNAQYSSFAEIHSLRKGIVAFVGGIIWRFAYWKRLHCWAYCRVYLVCL